MDFNIVTLEIADHIIHYDYYNRLVLEAVSAASEQQEEHLRIQNKSKEHLTKFFSGVKFYNADSFVRPLPEISKEITAKIQELKSSDIHDLVDKLERDAKKMKKLYKALTK